MSDRDHAPDIWNGPRDPHGLGRDVPPVTILLGGFVTVGHVERIHGEGGRPCPEYIPTRHELSLLARHWLREWIGFQIDWALAGQVGSAEVRIEAYAYDRLTAIANLIGHDVVRSIRDDVEKQLTATMSPEDLAHWEQWKREEREFAARLLAGEEASPDDSDPDD